MDKDQATLLEYQGDSPRWAAVKSFVSSSALMIVGPAAISAAWFKVSHKESFLTNLKEFVVGKQTWGVFGSIATVLVGAGSAFGAYVRADQQKAQHDRLVADNIAMRSQLNQTGQILRHVAHEVEQGKLADSTLTVKDDAPPSHVARLEAKEAAQAAQEALITH